MLRHNPIHVLFIGGLGPDISQQWETFFDCKGKVVLAAGNQSEGLAFPGLSLNKLLRQFPRTVIEYGLQVVFRENYPAFRFACKFGVFQGRYPVYSICLTCN